MQCKPVDRRVPTSMACNQWAVSAAIERVDLGCVGGHCVHGWTLRACSGADMTCIACKQWAVRPAMGCDDKEEDGADSDTGLTRTEQEAQAAREASLWSNSSYQ